MNLLDDANFDNKYSRFVEKISELSYKGPKGIEFYGGKATNLGIIYERGFNVPPAFVITTEAFSQFIQKNNLAGKIKEILKNLNVDNVGDINSCSEKIRNLIINSEIDEPLAKQIDSNKEFTGLVSVRSSATTEDSKDASFAGQLDSFLNVEPKQIKDNIKKCWASLFSPRAIFYRSKKGFSIHNSSMAVIVQKMLAPEVSGVTFTASPKDINSKDIVIDSAEGTGDNVVSGKVVPDNAIVSRNLNIIKNKSSKSKPVLIDKQIKEIAEKSIGIEKIFGLPQDIEWSIAQNKLFFLQARPISAYMKIDKQHSPITGKVIASGTPVSGGVVESSVCVINNVSELENFREGLIIMAKTTSPELVIIMSKASGIITEYGGLSSHAAIVSRELGIPCIVGCLGLFDKVKNGQKIIMDANTGKIYGK
jgi:pyruvate,water dikinase